MRVRCRDCGLGGHRDAEGVYYHGDRDVDPCPKSSDDFHHWEPVTIVLDFDGLLHAYTSGWTGPKPTDPPVDGALDFVRDLSDRGFELVVVSSRAETKQGCAAITDWLIEHGFPPVRVTYEKVQGDAYIDDRAVPFRGDFDELRVDLDRLLAHPKWWVPRADGDVAPRGEAEIRAEIARLEELRPTLARQYQRTAAAQKIETLRWALGEEEWTP